MQLCSSKELISFDCRSFLMKTHLSSFVRIIFDPNGSSFPRKLMLFSHEMKSPLQVRFLLGLLPKLWGKLLKAPICFRTQTCQFVQRYLLCEFSSIFVCCFFAISDQHSEMWNCISHDYKICKLVYTAAAAGEREVTTDHLLFVPNNFERYRGKNIEQIFKGQKYVYKIASWFTLLLLLEREKWPPTTSYLFPIMSALSLSSAIASAKKLHHITCHCNAIQCNVLHCNAMQCDVILGGAAI